MSTTDTRATLLTSSAPGPVAIIGVSGADASAVLTRVGLDLQPRDDTVRLARLEDDAGLIDEAVFVRTGSETTYLMPHGGPRVVQRILDALYEAGARVGDSVTSARFPETDDPVEQLMLETLARARSPLAIPLLLDQPNRWRRRPRLDADDVARSARLMRLVEPPLVVLAGAPNIGKSTLTNAFFGRAVSVVVDEPGTTRDYTAGIVDLAGLVVWWNDTPGLRTTSDTVETHAAANAASRMREADLLVELVDPIVPRSSLPRPADLVIGSRCDLGVADGVQRAVSGRSGAGLSDLVRAIRDRLVPAADRAHPGPWRFHPGLPESPAS